MPYLRGIGFPGSARRASKIEKSQGSQLGFGLGSGISDPLGNLLGVSGPRGREAGMASVLARGAGGPSPDRIRTVFTHRLLSSSFLGLPYRTLHINHKEELPRSLWAVS